MDEFTGALVANAMRDKYALAKAIAHFMFREIVEDIHADGKITDDEMMSLNKEACNRADFLVKVLSDKDTMLAFEIESAMCTGWEPPTMTDDLKERLKMYNEIAGDIKQIRLQIESQE